MWEFSRSRNLINITKMVIYPNKGFNQISNGGNTTVISGHFFMPAYFLKSLASQPETQWLRKVYAKQISSFLLIQKKGGVNQGQVSIIWNWGGGLIPSRLFYAFIKSEMFRKIYASVFPPSRFPVVGFDIQFLCFISPQENIFLVAMIFVPNYSFSYSPEEVQYKLCSQSSRGVLIFVLVPEICSSRGEGGGLVSNIEP